MMIKIDITVCFSGKESPKEQNGIPKQGEGWFLTILNFFFSHFLKDMLPYDFFSFLTLDGKINYSHTNLSLKSCPLRRNLLSHCIGLNIGL